jgi:murein DD-endopeptidase MepM/ murein hydrolase activator NlpD
MPARLILVVTLAAVWSSVGPPAPATAGTAAAPPAPAGTAAAPAATAGTTVPPPTPPDTSREVGASRWIRPVRGPATRLFDLGPDRFARGQHRGVDLDATPGESVRSACGGRVAFAGRVAGSGTVSVRCGPWRVSYAPLARIAVRAGARVAPGRRLGRVAGDEPLHLGVRREADPFGYVDPLLFLAAAADRAPPPVVPARLPRPAPRVRPAPGPARASPGVAPWPVWVGLALLMTGLAGVGTLRFPLRKPGGAACHASSTSSSSPTTPSSL